MSNEISTIKPLWSETDIPILRPFLIAILILSTSNSSVSAERDNICGDPHISCPALVYQGLTYPYPREQGSFLFIDGASYPYTKITEDLLGDSEVRLPGDITLEVSDLLEKLGLEELKNQRLHAVVGYGSNPAPSQLSRKYAADIGTGGIVMPVIKGSIENYDVVWTPLFVQYGGMPSTLFPSPGTKTDIWINWMTTDQRERADQTERLSKNWYTRTTLSPETVEFAGPNPDILEVYISCYGALDLGDGPIAVSAIPARGRIFASLSSPGVLQAVLGRFPQYETVIDLLYANVEEPEVAAKNTETLADLRLFPESGLHSAETCK